MASPSPLTHTKSLLGPCEYPGRLMTLSKCGFRAQASGKSKVLAQQESRAIPAAGKDQEAVVSVDKKALGAFESAIAAAEDDADLKALKKANDEVQEETREFDEDALEEDEGIG